MICISKTFLLLLEIRNHYFDLHLLMIKITHFTDPFSDCLLETFCTVIYTCVVTHLVGLKPTQLALHSDFDNWRFSKAAASVMTMLVGSAFQLKTVL